MCQWTFLSNLFGVQSDCPHRERFGYGGDLVTTSDAFMLNYDMETFYAKAARDWHDTALSDGMLTDTAPSVGIQYCGVGWAMAHPHLLMQLYRYCGDRRIVEEQYATAKRWLELVRKQNPDHIVREGLHDHEALEKEETSPMVTPLYCESANDLPHGTHPGGGKQRRTSTVGWRRRFDEPMWENSWPRAPAWLLRGFKARKPLPCI